MGKRTKKGKRLKQARKLLVSIAEILGGVGVMLQALAQLLKD